MARTVDNKEVERFGAIADEWWNPNGKFRPLHQINPVRLSYIRDQILNAFDMDRRAAKPLTQLTILDVGCGGGLLTEPLSRLGAFVTGLDPSPESIAAARSHAEAQGLDVIYFTGTVEDLPSKPAGFDCVIALEVVEHVPDVTGFLKSCAALIRPGGLLIVSTLNRTAKSFGLGIVAAEYVLGWLPKGTHQWNRFITPDELRLQLDEAGLDSQDQQGLVFNPLKGEWTLSVDCSVNYFISATKPAA